MSRLSEVGNKAQLDGRKLLIPYLVAGDPCLGATEKLMHQLVADGADIIELGIPFSDPSSDGPVIQLGAERAIAAGTSLADVCELMKRFRTKNSATPVVLMGYLNPIELMGYDEFTRKVSGAGVDGVLVVDMPPAESSALRQRLRDVNIDTIFLVAPTTGLERAKLITEVCSGYLYYVSLKGVTGAALSDPKAIRARVHELRALTKLPIVIGFGIRDVDSVVKMSEISDGVIIGSALVSEIAKLSSNGNETSEEIQVATKLIRDARDALEAKGLRFLKNNRDTL